MLNALVDAMDRPGRVFLYFTGLGLVFALLDAVYLSVTADVSLWQATVSPPEYDLFTRLLVLFLAFMSAIAGELVLTRYRRTQRQLEAERARLQALYEDNPSAIVSLDRDLVVSYVNRRAERLVGKPRSVLEGRRCYEAFVGGDAPCEGCLAPQVFETGETHSRIKHERTVTGRENWLSQMWYPLFDTNGRVESIVEIATDISELKLDPLTSLPNRLLFRDRLDVALAGARRHGQMLAVLFIDIDGFKEINDELGHAAGDVVLRSVADRMRSAVRQDETLARIGGDEFVLLVPTLDHPNDVERIAARVLSQLDESFHVGDSTLHITVSVGACVYQGGTATGADILDAADASMYEAKNAGGGTYRVAACTAA